MTAQASVGTGICYGFSVCDNYVAIGTYSIDFADAYSGRVAGNMFVGASTVLHGFSTTLGVSVENNFVDNAALCV